MLRYIKDKVLAVLPALIHNVLIGKAKQLKAKKKKTQKIQHCSVCGKEALKQSVFCKKCQDVIKKNNNRMMGYVVTK